jgi:hypothetical protein
MGYLFSRATNDYMTAQAIVRDAPQQRKECKNLTSRLLQDISNVPRKSGGCGTSQGVHDVGRGPLDMVFLWKITTNSDCSTKGKIRCRRSQVFLRVNVVTNQTEKAKNDDVYTGHGTNFF